MNPVAILREVPDAFVGCVTERPVSHPLDPHLARAQHRAYRLALEEGGFTTVVMPADEAHPDGSFVEDAAIVIGNRALATRPGHPSRRGEVGSVAAALEEFVPVERMQAPAHLDGGDVMVVGRTIYVGASDRTDAAGHASLADFAGEGWRVVPVAVSGVLHLKSAVTALDGATLLMESGHVDPASFGGLRIIETSPLEHHASNVVKLPDGTILAAEGSPASIAAMIDAGFPVRTVDVSEFARADGGLTCLSIRIRGE